MSTLNVAALQDVDGAGSKATLPITGSNFTLGPGWGALEFVSGANISAATNLDITGFVAGYDYIITVHGARPATDGVTLQGRFSQSTTFNTGSSYGDQTSAAATSMKMGGNTHGNASTEGFTAIIIVPEPNVGSRMKWCHAQEGLGAGTNGVVYGFGHGGGSFHANENAVDGLRLYLSSGDWTAAGKCYVFRRRLS
jgi:hypothetical protein